MLDRLRRAIEPSRTSFLPRRGRRPLGDWIFLGVTAAAALALVALTVALVVILVQGSWLTLGQYGPAFLWRSVWRPGLNVNLYGALPFIAGTLITSLLALLLAVPVSLGVAIFISEHAPSGLRGGLSAVVDLLAAVPSVVFGFWGLWVLVPFMHTTLEPLLGSLTPGNPLTSGSTPGTGILTASIVLAVMILPTITAVSREVMQSVPQSQREAALSLGATRWETIRIGVVKYSRSGIVGAIILGLGRAMGETMAVTMTIGNQDAIPTSLFSQGQTMASLIANEFLDPTGPLDKSALLEIALILLAITFAVNVVARGLVWGLTHRGNVA
ncbi:MAG: phosphate ABC transporter permease subunit PstC [Thermoplasmata archaeon]